MVNRKPKNVVQKFRGFWSGLRKEEKEDLYDLLSAIRGPDIENDSQYQTSLNIKKLGTGRVRYLLVGDINKGITEPFKLDKSDLVKLSALIKKTNSIKNFSHYSGHLRIAIETLEEIGIKEFKDWRQND